MELTNQKASAQSTWTIRDLFMITAVAAISLAVGEFGRENGMGITSQPEKFPELIPIAQFGALVSAVFFAAWIFIAYALFNIAKQDEAFGIQPGHLVAWVVAAFALAGMISSLSYATCHYFFSESIVLSNGQPAVVDPQWLGRLSLLSIAGLALAKACVWFVVLLRVRIRWVWRVSFFCFLCISVFQGAMTCLVGVRMSGNIGGRSIVGGRSVSGWLNIAFDFLNVGLVALQVIVFLSLVFALLLDKIRKRPAGRYHQFAVWLYILQCLTSLAFAAAASLLISA